MIRRAFAFTVILLCAVCVSAQTTRRPRLKAEQTPAVASIAADTVYSPEGISVTGFDKPLRSSRESFFVVNGSGITVEGISLTIVYTDMEGRQLHSRTAEAECEVPPGETRSVDIPAWDRQKALYYFRNPPSRPRTAATPFKVKISINHILTTPEKDKQQQK